LRALLFCYRPIIRGYALAAPVCLSAPHANLARPFSQVLKEEEGNAEMRRLRKLIADGAREYLMTQYKWLTLWVAVMVSCTPPI
jgi:Na+/H+-translocating membrane pyrophosphatase